MAINSYNIADSTQTAGHNVRVTISWPGNNHHPLPLHQHRPISSPTSLNMALAFGSSTISTYSTRFPIRISPRTSTHAPTVVAVKKRVVFATTVETSIRPPTVQFDIPYTTIELFFRTEISTLLRSRHDTPSVQLVLDDVPTVALPSLRLYIERINDHVKYVAPSCHPFFLLSVSSVHRQLTPAESTTAPRQKSSSFPAPAPSTTSWLASAAKSWPWSTATTTPSPPTTQPTKSSKTVTQVRSLKIPRRVLKY